jgi:hypothetical protein
MPSIYNPYTTAVLHIRIWNALLEIMDCELQNVTLFVTRCEMCMDAGG